jgi:hypothetical protein
MGRCTNLERSLNHFRTPTRKQQETLAEMLKPVENNKTKQKYKKYNRTTTPNSKYTSIGGGEGGDKWAHEGHAKA